MVVKTAADFIKIKNVKPKRRKINVTQELLINVQQNI